MPRQLIFTDDLVTKNTRIGIVERAPNSSDDDSANDDDDDIVDDDVIAETHDTQAAPNQSTSAARAAARRLEPGAAHVLWANEDTHTTEYVENLTLADRVFLLGDVVSRADRHLGQTGVIVGMRMFCDLKCADGTLLKRVPTGSLQPLAACRPGALVFHPESNWLGRVDEVYDNVLIAFDDGANCKLLRTNANSLQVHTSTLDEQSWYWPGMRVSATREALKRAKWLKGKYRRVHTQMNATVVRIHAAQAIVRWLAGCPTADAAASPLSIEPPAEMQRPSNLVELHDHHARRCWRLGEHAALPRGTLERLRAAAPPPTEPTPIEGVGISGRRLVNIEACVEVVGCHTRVDVQWQDGSREADEPAVSFAPAKHVDSYYEFWPQDFVVGKSAGPGEEPPVGVVESVNHSERICVVTWRDSGTREIVPVYDLSIHADFSFKLGDIVLKLPDVAQEGEPTSNDVGFELSGGETGREAGAKLNDAQARDPSTTAAAAAATADSDDEEVPPASHRSGALPPGLGKVGEVKSIGPKLLVRWMDGTEGESTPESLYMVNIEEEDVGETDPDSVDESVFHLSHEEIVAASGDPDSEEEAEEGPTVATSRANHVEGGNSSGWETVDSDAEYDDEDDNEVSDENPGPPDMAEMHAAAVGMAAELWARQSSANAARPAETTGTPQPPPPLPIDSLAVEARDGDVEMDDAEEFTTAEEASTDGSGSEDYDKSGVKLDSVVGDANLIRARTDSLCAAAPDSSVESSAASAAAPPVASATVPPAASAAAPDIEATSSAHDAMGPGGYSSAAIEAAGFERFAMTDEEDLSFHSFASYSPFAPQRPQQSASSSSTSTAAAAPAAAEPPAVAYPPGFSRIAQKQWKLLRQGLPDGMYVVAFPSRVDLLRAIIVGAHGTPYHDALFVFDLQLPPEFPQQPPAVNYISHGERINPNLYENGKVCLSLLGTWTGKQSCELWNPKTSTLLQVLVSIQALVLCEQPYYNEAGYEKQQGSADGAFHARRYNEGALLLSLKSMMNTLAMPSPPFQKLILAHFAAARSRILGRCRKLLTLKAAAQATLEASVGAGTSTAAAHAASESDAVKEANLHGVLNSMPSLGFLHSLGTSVQRLEAALDKAESAAS